MDSFHPNPDIPFYTLNLYDNQETFMKTLTTLLLLAITAPALACENQLLDQDFRRLASKEEINLCETFHDKVVLIVNTASKCGNTPQYDGLEKLYEQYNSDGLVVLGFPSNDFMGQEPGTEGQIEEFCRLTYGIEFPMFEKTTVKKNNAHPLFVALAESSGTYPTWNFHKYLIGRDGALISDFRPQTPPYDDKLVAAIEQALSE